MAYAAIKDFAALYPETEVPQQRLQSLLQAAEEDIDALTFNRIRAKGFESLTPFQQEKVRRAVCMQAKYREDYGDLMDNPLSGYGINGVSVAYEKSQLVTQDGVQTSPKIYALLRQTGLTYRGLDREGGRSGLKYRNE